jgi:hypothetical protein
MVGIFVEARGTKCGVHGTKVSIFKRYIMHIYAILEFELLIGHSLDNLFQEKTFPWEPY